MTKTRLLLIALIAAIWLPVQSQTICWEEDFDMPPTGWNLDTNWVFQDEALMFRWFPQTTDYDISAISPLISLPEGVTNLTLLQYIGINTYLVTDEMTEISIIHDSEETLLWEYACSNGNWGSLGGTILDLPIENFAGQDIQIKIRSYGPSTIIWDYWYVYEMHITALYPNDLELTELSGPKNIQAGVNATWDATITNLGANVLDNVSIDLTCNKTGEIISSADYANFIQPNESVVVQLQWTPDSAYNTTIRAKLEQAEDIHTENNISNLHFLRIESDMEYDVLVIDKDNGIPTIVDPETNWLGGAQYGIENALMDAGINYTYHDKIPSDIQDYEIVILTLGSYCVG